MPFVESGTTEYSYAVINISLRRFFYEQLRNSSEKYCIFKDSTLLYTNLNTLENISLSPDMLDSELNIEGEKYTFISSANDGSGLLYVSLTKSSNLLSPISSLKLVFLCTLLISLLLAILFSTVFSQKIYHPIIALFEQINPKSDDEDIDELAYIERYISDFEQEKNKIVDLSRNHLLRQLLHDDYSTMSEPVLNKYQNSKFVVFTIEHYGYDPSCISFAELISEQLAKEIPADFDFEIFNIDFHNTSVLLFTDRQCDINIDNGTLSSLFTVLSNIVSEHTKNVFISSSPLIEIDSVHNEFIKTLSALKQKIYCNENDLFIFTDNIYCTPHHGINSYFFDFENELLSAIKRKDMDSVCVCLDECFAYIEENKINAESVIGWLTILRDEIFDIPLSLGYSATEIFYKDIEQLKSSFKYNKTISDYKTYFKDIAQLAIQGITVKTSQKHNILINDIKTFIKENLENDTSLNTIAYMYHITPQYLSALFTKRIPAKRLCYM